MYLICELSPLAASAYSMKVSMHKDDDINASVFTTGSLYAMSIRHNSYTNSIRKREQLESKARLLGADLKDSNTEEIEIRSEQVNNIGSSRSEQMSSHKADQGSLKIGAGPGGAGAAGGGGGGGDKY